MRIFLVSIALLFTMNTQALDSEMKFTSKELNEIPLIATTRTDIAVAIRVLQLQFDASGCLKSNVDSSDIYEKPQEFRFSFKSENCIVIPKSSKCDSGYTPRNILANPNSRDGIVLGAEKYLICLKSSSGTPGGSTGTGSR